MNAKVIQANTCGIGLRLQHIDQILEQKPAIAWLEVLSDNFLLPNTIYQEYLVEVVEHYPITLHGVGLSLGSIDPLDPVYLSQLKALVQLAQPAWVSDHLCWSSAHGFVTHDLIPMPYNETTLYYVADRIKQVQDYLGLRLVIENVSSYLQYQNSTLAEWEFIAEVTRVADCDLLLDINNVYVNASNHDFDPSTYLAALPAERIREIHLAGHEDRGTHLLDTHSRAVAPAVWDLYANAIQRFGFVPTLIEWDNDIPSLERLLQEAQQAQEVARHAAC